jgi:hypothetical protein
MAPLTPVEELVEGTGDDLSGPLIQDQSTRDTLKEVPAFATLSCICVIKEDQAILADSPDLSVLLPVRSLLGTFLALLRK